MRSTNLLLFINYCLVPGFTFCFVVLNSIRESPKALFDLRPPAATLRAQRGKLELSHGSQILGTLPSIGTERIHLCSPIKCGQGATSRPRDRVGEGDWAWAAGPWQVRIHGRSTERTK